MTKSIQPTDNNLIEFENDQELAEFQSALKRIDDLSHNALSVLNDFGLRLTAIESVIKPLSQSTNDLVLLDKNISKTLIDLGALISHLDTATKEEQVIVSGPKDGNLIQYIGSLKRLDSASQYLGTAEFATNEASKLTKLQTIKAAIQHLINYETNALKKLEAENFEMTTAPKSFEEAVLDTKKNIGITEDLISELEEIYSYLISHNQNQSLNFYIKNFVDLLVASRSSYLTKKLNQVEHFITKPQKLETIHENLSQYIDLIITIVQKESRLIKSIISDKYVQILNQIVTPVYFNFEKTLDSLFKDSKKEVYEKITIVLSLYSLLVEKLPDIKTCFKECNIVSHSSLVNLHSDVETCIKGFLPRFYEKITTTTKTYKELPEDGTVQETVTEFVSISKKLAKYSNLINIILKSIEKHPCINKIDSENHELHKTYYSNIFMSIRSSSKLHCEKYKKKDLIRISTLNNIHYIIKSVKTDKNLNDSVLPSIKKVLETELKNSEGEYYQSWINCFSPLTDTKLLELSVDKSLSSSEKHIIKDSLKDFNLKFEEFCRMQKDLTIYDLELRTELVSHIESMIIPLYNNCKKRFFTTGFAKTPSKYFRFDNDLITKAIKYAID